jgi:hypothetical protein
MKITRFFLGLILFSVFTFILNAGKKYDPSSLEKFKISRSKIELFLKCPRCFYLACKHGMSLQNCLSLGSVNLTNIDLEDLDDVEDTCYQYPLPGTNFLIVGAVDMIDLDRCTQELFVASFEFHSELFNMERQKGYKREFEIVQWILRKQGHKVSNTAYIVFFDECSNAQAYEGNDSWVDGTIAKMYGCLKMPIIPPCRKDCALCRYMKDVETKKTYNNVKN